MAVPVSSNSTAQLPTANCIKILLPGVKNDGSGNHTLHQNRVLPTMDAKMSETTKKEVMFKLSRPGRNTGKS